MRKKIFALVILWMVAVLVMMAAIHYPIIKNAEYGQAESQIQYTSDTLQKELEFEVKNLKVDMESLSLMFDGGMTWLDGSIGFLESHASVDEIHRFDADRVFEIAQAQKGRSISLDLQSLEGMFFYQPMILEPFDSERVLIYYKGDKDYLLFVVNIRDLFEPMLSSRNGMQGVYDQHLVPVVEAGESLNARGFFDEAGAGRFTGYADEFFYSVSGFEFENMSFNTLVIQMDQKYRRAVRLYLVRFTIIAMTLMAIGFLVAWRIIKAYRQAMLSQNLGQLPELADIKKNIIMAINHMNMASKSFDDINLLREELEMLYADLEEGVQNEKEVR